MSLSAGEIATILGIAAAIFGWLGWFGRGIWAASKKDSALQSHGEDIAAIKKKQDSIRADIEAAWQKDLDALHAVIANLSDKIDGHRRSTMEDLKVAVCDAMRLALKDQELRWLEKLSVVDKDLAVVTADVDQLKADINNLFNRVRVLEGGKSGG